jgi:TolB protein
VDNFKLWVAAAEKQTNKGTPLPPLIPDTGSLVFVTSRDGNREIYTIRTNGEDLNRLTNNPADDYSPDWSPNGRRIAFVSTREGNPDIFVMNRDGSDMTRLTDDPENDLDPSWSPDGARIVFSSAREGHPNLYILDVETKTVERITEGDFDDRYPDWSPDGKTILFQSNRDLGINFYTYEVETQKIKRITFDTTSSLNHPVWSPSGLFYAYEKNFGGSGVGIATKEFPNKNQFTVVGAYLEMNSWPAWSPDGSQIAFVSNSDNPSDIYIISADGTAIYRLTNDASIESELDWTSR